MRTEFDIVRHLTPRGALLAAIRLYKRVLSPRKGYGCAWRVHTGGASCSTLGYRAVARYGVFRGLGVLGLRLDQCRLKHERHGGARRLPLRRGQAGFVDCACEAGLCDGAACETCGSALDVLDCAACASDSDCDCDDGCAPLRDARRGCGARLPRRGDGGPVRERGRRRGTPPGPSGDSPPLDHDPNSIWP